MNVQEGERNYLKSRYPLFLSGQHLAVALLSSSLLSIIPGGGKLIFRTGQFPWPE